MSNEVTMKAIEELLDTTLDKKLEPILKTLTQHTAALAALMAEYKDRDDATAIAAFRFDRLEKWAQQVGSKIGVNLDL
ncbi:MAG TPA: hypothetical protein VKU19_07455 [Bryobacteraceae bacterium]|nr:hypothetical protein [Bryobacteraceae bacterium]